MIAVILAFLVALCGTLWTYSYDARSPLSVRFAMGICSGFAVFSTVCFALSCLLGLNAFSILLALGLCALPLWLARSSWQSALQNDFALLKSGRTVEAISPRALWTTRIALTALFAFLVWCFRGVSYFKPDGMYTAYETNIGDLTFHIQIMTNFAWGHNFPPQNPIYAGSLFAYPFLPDFLTAVWLRCGANLQLALHTQNLLLAFALMTLLHRVSLELVRDRLAALLTPFLVIFCGGLGWIMFIADASGSESGFWSLLKALPRQYTNTDPGGWRWSNSLTTLFITQRSLLLGLPVALTIFLLWRRFLVENPRENSETTNRKPLLAAGFLLSTLPLIHSHTFLTVALCSFYFLALMAWKTSVWYRRDWLQNALRFALAVAPIAIIEIVYLSIARRSEGEATKGAFFAWNFGWDKGDANFFVFWLKNTGALWPLIFFALWRRTDSKRALKLFAFFWIPLLLLIPKSSDLQPLITLKVLVGLYLACVPFVVAWIWNRVDARNRNEQVESESSTRSDNFWRGATLFLAVVCTVGFVMPNLIRFAPWVWDNNKILIYWFVISVPFAALGLAHLWRARSWKRALSVFLFFTMTWAGALDIWHGANGQLEQRNFDNDGIALAADMRKLPPGSTILHAPTYNSPVCLSGQRSVMGYSGHVSSHGLDPGPREAEMRSFLTGETGSERVLEKYKVAAFVVGPQEIQYLKDQNPPMALASPRWWNKWKKVAQHGEYSLYTTR